jgi:DNA polymerase-3 subunit gamma/tau
VLAGEIATALTQLDELARGGKDLSRLLGDLLNHFRNLLIFQVSKGDLNLLEVSEAEVAALQTQATLAPADAFTRILEVLADAELRLRDAASKKILLEVTLLRAIEARQALSLDAVLKQLQQLRGQSGPVAANVSSQPVSSPSSQPTSPLSPPPTSSPSKPAPATSPEPRPTPPPETPVDRPPPSAAPALASARPAGAASPERRPPARSETPAPPAPAVSATGAAMGTPAVAAAAPGNLRELWSSLVEAVGRVSPFTRGYLIDAHPVSFDKQILVIGFDPEFEDHLGLVDNARNHTLLATKLAELGHQKAMIKFIKAEAPAGWARTAMTAAPPPPAATKPAAVQPAPAATTASVPATPAAAAPAAAAEKKTAAVPFSKDDFKNDPLIQKALEIFKGTIIEVRA